MKVVPWILLTVVAPVPSRPRSPVRVVKVGTPEAFARRIWPAVPVICAKLLVELAYRILFVVRLLRPVPPLETLRVVLKYVLLLRSRAPDVRLPRESDLTRPAVKPVIFAEAP